MADRDMQRPSWLQANMSVGNIASIGATLLAVGGFWALTTHRLDAMETSLSQLNTAGVELAQLTYRVTAAERSLQQIDTRFDSFTSRLDRSAETTAAGLAAITSAIAALDTRVAVLTQRVESLSVERRSDADGGR